MTSYATEIISTGTAHNVATTTGIPAATTTVSQVGTPTLGTQGVTVTVTPQSVITVTNTCPTIHVIMMSFAPSSTQTPSTCPVQQNPSVTSIGDMIVRSRENNSIGHDTTSELPMVSKPNDVLVKVILEGAEKQPANAPGTGNGEMVENPSPGPAEQNPQGSTSPNLTGIMAARSSSTYAALIRAPLTRATGSSTDQYVLPTDGSSQPADSGSSQSVAPPCICQWATTRSQGSPNMSPRPRAPRCRCQNTTSQFALLSNRSSQPAAPGRVRQTGFLNLFRNPSIFSNLMDPLDSRSQGNITNVGYVHMNNRGSDLEREEEEGSDGNADEGSDWNVDEGSQPVRLRGGGGYCPAQVAMPSKKNLSRVTENKSLLDYNINQPMSEPQSMSERKRGKKPIVSDQLSEEDLRPGCLDGPIASEAPSGTMADCNGVHDSNSFSGVRDCGGPGPATAASREQKWQENRKTDQDKKIDQDKT